MRNDWSFTMVQDRLVEATQAWWRCEGGRWPFAGDAPWHLAARELYGPDVDKDAPTRRLPLTRAEVAKRDEAADWLTWVDERDRRIVVLAVLQLASGKHARVQWAQLRAKLVGGPGGLEVAITARGLGMRYARAIAAIARRLSDERVAA